MAIPPPKAGLEAEDDFWAEDWVDEAEVLRRAEAEKLRIADEARVTKLVQEGPHFIGEGVFKKVLLPTKEGMRERLVYCHQVPSSDAARAICGNIDDLEYWCDWDPGSVLARLDRNLMAAHAQRGKGANALFEEKMQALLAQKEGADQRVRGEVACEAPIAFHSSERLPSGAASSMGRRGEMQDAEDAGTHFVVPVDQGKTGSSAALKEKEKASQAGGAESRPEMKIDYSAVFDGHGKSQHCAALAAQHHKRYLSLRLSELAKHGLVGIHYALKFATVDLSRSYDAKKTGATSNACLELDEDSLWCANLGDTRAAIVTESGEVVQLSEDQKPLFKKTDLGGGEAKLEPNKFTQGVRKRRHFVVDGRVDGRLAVARAIGNGQKTSGRSKVTMITRKKIEEILGHKLPPGERLYLVQACDGVFDVSSTEQVGRLVAGQLKKGHSCARVAADVVKVAFDAGSDDNLSCVVRQTRL